YGGLENYVKGRVLFAGESAGQTNALTKGGIAPGMVGGRWAAEAVLKDRPELYDRRWKASSYSVKHYEHIFNNFSKHMKDEHFDESMKPLHGTFSSTSMFKAAFNWKYLPDYLALLRGLSHAW
ncbi:MAG: hypothetical protein GOV15_02140, partial [Candidatus Diapherotrites archaeon]|nr:hypothetical protein [Candidatus Diapherotrites archaeon]